MSPNIGKYMIITLKYQTILLQQDIDYHKTLETLNIFTD